MKEKGNPIDPILWDAIMTMVWHRIGESNHYPETTTQMRKESKATYVFAGLVKQR